MREYGKRKYQSSLADSMLSFFEEYDEGFGAPSFAKFARAIGVTVSHLEEYRKYKRFDAAYRECCEIRRDYLIDMALSKRFDPTFVRHLITEEMESTFGDAPSSLTIKVVE